MPVVSQAQNAAMHSAAEGRSTLGIPASVGKEFTADQKPGSVKKLPQRKGPPKKAKELHKQASISNKQYEKLEDKYFGKGEHARHEQQERREAKYGGKDQQPIDAASR